MSIYYCILFFILRLYTAQGDCTPTTCSDRGPTIRFPFRLKNHQPPHCGYPGFDLSCSPNSTATLLNLPYSVQVLVTNIDYKAQSIHIKDPNSCFPQQLQNLSLSTTPFQFADPVYDYSLFSCPPSTNPDFSYWNLIPCLGGDGREVRVAFNDSIKYAPPQLISCRKMFNVLSVPDEVFDQTPHLQLEWLQPVCGECEAKGKFCRLKRNSTSDEIECFGNLNPLKKGISWRDIVNIGLDVVSFVVYYIVPPIGNLWRRIYVCLKSAPTIVNSWLRHWLLSTGKKEMNECS